MPGSNASNPDWARRKINVVKRFLKSTYRMVLEQQRPDRTFKVGEGLDIADYVLAGGGFPVTVKGAGVIGVIAVSGLPEREDHGVVVDAILRSSGHRSQARTGSAAGSKMTDFDPKSFLTSIFNAAVAAADPGTDDPQIICRRSRRAARSSSAPARARRRWRLPSRRSGTARSKGSSSPATAMAPNASASRSSKRRIRCPMRPGSRPRGACSRRCPG